MQDDSSAITMASVAISRMDAHEKVCGERYQEIGSNLADIKSTLRTMSADIRDSVQRIHTRIEDEATLARGATSATAAEARSNANLALTAANAAKEEIANTKIIALSSAVGAAGGVIMWLATMIFGKH